MKYLLLTICLIFTLLLGSCATAPLNTNDNPQDIIGTGIKSECEQEKTGIEKRKNCI